MMVMLMPLSIIISTTSLNSILSTTQFSPSSSSFFAYKIVLTASWLPLNNDRLIGDPDILDGLLLGTIEFGCGELVGVVGPKGLVLTEGWLCDGENSWPRCDICCVTANSPPSSTHRITHITSERYRHKQWN